MVWAHHYFCKLESLEKSKFFFLSLLSPTNPMPKLEMCLKTHLKTLPPSFIFCINFWNLFNSRRMPLVTWYDYFISYSRLFWDVAGVILTRTKLGYVQPTLQVPAVVAAEGHVMFLNLVIHLYCSLTSAMLWLIDPLNSYGELKPWWYVPNWIVIH